MSEESWKEKFPGHGRSRDDWPAGRAGPRRNVPVPIPVRTPDPVPAGRVASLSSAVQLIFFMKRRFLKGSGGRLEIGFYLQENSAGAEIAFYLHREFRGVDLVENECFTTVRLDNVCGFSDFDRGTMREKMAIFKERKCVCRVQNVSMGATLMKIVILLK